VTITFALDTSSASTFMAIHKEGQVFSAASSSSDSHAESMSNLFQKLLSDASCGATDIKQIIFGSGPGSFTGLRIGLGFVKGLAVGLGLPVCKISSILALASSVRLELKEAETVCVLTDARRNEYFAALFRVVSDQLLLIGSTEIVASIELEAWINAQLSSENNRLPRIIGFNIPSLPSQAEQLSEYTNIAELLVRLAGHPSAIKITSQDLAQLEPEYIRELAAKKISER
jgi:tRNA threonylcarbamoyl adenosine modification protein YeaZ